MYSYPADDPAIELLGALAARPKDGMLQPSRLPEKFTHEIPTNFMRVMTDAAAGVRLRFRTSATRVRLRLQVSPIGFVDSPPPAPVAVDLILDGELAATHHAHGTPLLIDFNDDTVRTAEGHDEDIDFAGLEPRDKMVEIWLPHNAIVKIVKVTTDEPIRGAAGSKKRWIHHGSSISHCFEATSPTRTWPAVAARILDYELLNLGFAGNALLDPFVARAIRDEPADLISLKLGINLVNGDTMRMRSLLPAVDGYLDTIRERHPTVPLLLISPIACPIVEKTPGPTVSDESGKFRTSATPPFANDTLTLARIREALAQFVAARSAHDTNLYYLDGRELFGDTDAAAGHLPDHLHPDDQGYQMMGNRFALLLPQLVAP